MPRQREAYKEQAKEQEKIKIQKTHPQHQHKHHQLRQDRQDHQDQQDKLGTRTKTTQSWQEQG